MLKILIGLALLFGGQAALAATAAELYRDGEFAGAATAGRTEATAASLIVAGKSAIVIASFKTTDRQQALALVAAAEKDFDAALAKAPNNLEAQLQKATATGYTAKLTRSPSLAKQTKAMMEAVVARDPNYGLGWASIGGWHAGSITTLGRLIASTVLGASWSTALTDFDTALAKDPQNPVHPAFYALTLLDYDPATAPRATELLHLVARLPPRDAYETLLKKSSAQVLALLAAGDTRGAHKLAHQLLPFGKLA